MQTVATAITVHPTWYDGRMLRSSTEARWAVLMDSLGVHWQYEPRRFDLGPLGYYWPDFWLPQHRYWIEVKPDAETAAEEDAFRRMNLVTQITGCQGIILAGFVNLDSQDENESGYALYGTDVLGYSTFNRWCECTQCQQRRIMPCHHPKRIRMAYNMSEPLGARWCEHRDQDGFDTFESRTPRLRDAYDAARLYTFGRMRGDSLKRAARARKKPRPDQLPLFTSSPS